MIQRETHAAVVADTNDPEKLFRIKVKCVALMGSEDVVLPFWILPKIAWGFVVVPDIGEQVEIEVTTGSDTDEVPGQSFIDSPDIRWTGVRFQGTIVYDAMFTANYGKRRGFVTPAGHILVFDDTKGKEKINLVWHNTEGGYAMFSIDEAGSILLANKNGSMVYLNADAGEVAVIDENGNSFSTDAQGVKLVDKSGDFVSLDGDGKLIQLQAGAVYCGGLTGTEPGVLGNKMQLLHDGHIHPTGTGPSGVAVPGVPFPSLQILSQVLQLK